MTSINGVGFSNVQKGDLGKNGDMVKITYVDEQGRACEKFVPKNGINEPTGNKLYGDVVHITHDYDLHDWGDIRDEVGKKDKSPNLGVFGGILKPNVTGGWNIFKGWLN